MEYLHRHIEDIVRDSEKTFKCVLLTGARQNGKSTLLKKLFPEKKYVPIDDTFIEQQANENPNLFMMLNPPPAFYDEVQRAPDLFRFIKIKCDETNEKGLFCLSGSQPLELMEKASESLAGRVSILELSGLSLREIQSINFTDPFLPTLEYIQKRNISAKQPENIWEVIHRGSYPEIQDKSISWSIFYSSYIKTYLERDVRNLSAVQDLNDFRRFMVAVAARTGQLLNYANIADEIGKDAGTIRNWISILEASGIIYILEPYTPSVLKRAIKTPKVYFKDTGLAAYLTSWLTPATLENHYNLFGKNEGRAASADDVSTSFYTVFDAAYYAAQNPDVVAAFGNDSAKLLQHYLVFGIKEGRQPNQYFNVDSYIAAYPDIKAAFGDNKLAALQHFISNGIKEHRTLGGFPAEKILPGGTKAVASSSSSSSSGGGSSSSGSSSSSSSSSSSTIAKTVEGVTAANEAVSDELDKAAVKDRDGNITGYEVASEEERVALVNNAKAALQTANAVAAEKLAAKETAAAKSSAAATKLAEAEQAVTDAGLDGVATTEVAALKAANEAYYGTSTTVGAKDALIAAQNAKTAADAALAAAQTEYDDAVAALKTAQDNAYQVLTGVCGVDANMIDKQDPEVVADVLATEAAKLTAASNAVTSLLSEDDPTAIDADKVADAKSDAADTALENYQTAYLADLVAKAKAGKADGAADDVVAAGTAAETTLKAIYGDSVTVTASEVKVDGADPDATLITKAQIGTWTDASLDNKTLAETIADAQAAIDENVSAYNKAKAADEANTTLTGAGSRVTSAANALGDSSSGAIKAANDAAATLEQKVTAESNAAKAITDAQADLDEAYDTATVKDEENNDVALTDEQKSILKARDEAQTAVIVADRDTKLATAESEAADEQASTAKDNYDAARTATVATE